MAKKAVMVAWSQIEHYPPVTNMAVHLSQLGWFVRLHCLGSCHKATPLWASGKGIEIVRHGESIGALAKGRTLWRMAQAVRQDIKDADLLVLHSFQAFGIFAIVRFGSVSCPVVYAAHEFYPQRELTAPHRLAKALCLGLARTNNTSG